MNRSANKLRSQADLDDDAMSPEYDFSSGERGRYAHLFGESAEDETLVAAFWRSLGIDARRFAEKESRFSKAPDFELFRNGRPIALCEVKTITSEAASGAKLDVAYNRISNVVHTAARQLESVNLKHKYRNVLVLVNRCAAAKPEHLISVLTGYWDPLHGVFNQGQPAPSGNVRDEKKKIDLFVWMEGDSESTPVFFVKAEVQNDIRREFQLSPEKLKPIR